MSNIFTWLPHSDMQSCKLLALVPPTSQEDWSPSWMQENCFVIQVVDSLICTYLHHVNRFSLYTFNPFHSVPEIRIDYQMFFCSFSRLWLKREINGFNRRCAGQIASRRPCQRRQKLPKSSRASSRWAVHLNQDDLCPYHNIIKYHLNCDVFVLLNSTKALSTHVTVDLLFLERHMRIWQPTGKHQRLKGNKSWGSCCCGRLAMAKCITFQRQLDAFFHGPLFFCALTVFAWSHGFSFWIAREYLRRWHPDKNPVRSQVNKKLVVGIAPPEFIQHSKDESKETATAVIQFLYANKDRIFSWTQHSKRKRKLPTCSQVNTFRLDRFNF